MKSNARITFPLLCFAVLFGAGTIVSPLEAADGPQTYLAFGDSITAGAGDEAVASETGWTSRLETLLNDAGCDVHILNRGLGAEATPEGVTRIDSVLAEGGDLIFIMEGTNDISRQNISPETTKFNLREMGRKAANRGFEVVHTTTIPRWPTAAVDANNVTNKLMNELIRDVSGASGHKLVDHWEIFGQAPDRFRTLYADFPKDPVGHPNPQGYDLMAQSYFDVLLDIDTVPPVPGLISPPNKKRRVAPRAEISVDIWDFGEKIKRENSFLLVNGEVVDADVIHGARFSHFSFVPRQNLRRVVSVGIRSEDRASPANTFDREVSTFAVIGTVYSVGDLDLSGRVDGWDAVILGLAMGSIVGEVRYNQRADLNFDFFVDDADLKILRNNFGS